MWQFLAVCAATVALAYLSQCLTLLGEGHVRVPARGPLSWIVRLRSTRPVIVGGWNAADVVMVALLTVFSTFRYSVGTDFELYSGMYRRLNAADWYHSLRTVPQEPGFTLFRLLLKSLVGGNPVWLFFATTVLTLVPAVVAIKLLAREHFALAMALYCTLGTWVSGMNGLRQAIANALILLAVALVQRHRGWAVALLIVAVSFHVSAILPIALLALTWRWWPSPGRLAVIMLGVGVVAAIALPFLAPLVGKINPRYARYISHGAGAGVGTVVQIVLIAATLVMAWRFLARRNDAERRYFVWASLSLPMLIIGTRVVELGRLHLYFKTYLIFVLASVLPRLCGRKRWAWGLVGAVLAAYLSAYLHFYDGVLPYRIWIGRVR